MELKETSSDPEKYQTTLYANIDLFPNCKPVDPFKEPEAGKDEDGKGDDGKGDEEKDECTLPDDLSERTLSILE